MTAQHGNSGNSFENALLYAGVQEPLEGITQIIDAVWNKHYKVNIASKPEDSGATGWIADQVGTALGTLPWFYAANRLGQSMSDAAFSNVLGETSRPIVGSAMGGFLLGSVLQPSSNKNLLLGRLENGAVGAASLATLTGTYAGLGMLSGKSMLRNTAFGSVLGRPIAMGAIAGLPSAFVGTESQSLLQTGHLSSGNDLGRSLSSMALVGGMMGGMQRYTSAILPKIASDAAPSAGSISDRGGMPNPLTRLANVHESSVATTAASASEARTTSGAVLDAPETRTQPIDLKTIEEIPNQSPLQQAASWQSAFVQSADSEEAKIALLEQLPNMDSGARSYAVAFLRQQINMKGGDSFEEPVQRDLYPYVDRLQGAKSVAGEISRTLEGDNRPTDMSYTATEYSVTGHNAKLIVSSHDIPEALSKTDFTSSRDGAYRTIREGLQSVRPRAEDMVALMDEVPDRRLLANIKMVSDRVTAQVNANRESPAGADTGRLTNDIGIYHHKNDQFFATMLKHEWAHRLQYSYSSTPDDQSFETAAALESPEYNRRSYATDSYGENWAVHLGEGLLGSRLDFLQTAWAAPARAAILGRVWGRAMDTLPEEMQSTAHGEYMDRLQYIQDHIVPQARSEVAEKLATNDDPRAARPIAELLADLSKGQNSWITNLQGVDEPIQHLYLSSELPMSAEDWDALSRLHNVQNVIFNSDGPVTPQMASSFPRSVTSLQITTPSFVGTGTPAVQEITRLPNLESLELNSDITDESVQVLSQAQRLKNLAFHTSYFYGGSAAALSKLPSLENLTVTGEVASNAFDGDGTLSQLKSLTLRSNPLHRSGSSQEPLASLPRNLESFSHNGVAIPAQTLETIARSPQLQSFAFTGYPEDSNWELIGRLKNLTSLKMHTPRVDGNAARAVSNLSNLRNLSIHSVGLWDDAFEPISQMKGLRSVTIEYSPLSSYGRDMLEHMDWLDNLDIDRADQR